MIHDIDDHHEQGHIDSIEGVLEEYNSIKSELAVLFEKKEKYQKDFRLLKPWGDIKWKKIERIKKLKWKFSFHIAPESAFKEVEDDPFVLDVTKFAGNIYFVNVRPESDSRLIPFEELELPQMPLGQVGKILGETEEKIARLNEQKFHLGKFKDVLEKNLLELQDKFKLQEVQESMLNEGECTIKIINAWFPTKSTDKVKSYLDGLDLYYNISNPDLQDDVPIMLKNNRYAGIFENITNVYQLPNYRELDLTPFIGVFYPIFFAYCLGDTGYGLVLLILSFAALFGPLKKKKSIAYLGIVLGIFTSVIGILKSGTVFGLSISESRQIPIFDALSEYIFITDDQNFIFNAFNVSLMIGLFQILFGVVLSFIRKVKYQSISMAIPMFAKFLIITSSVALFLGASQEMEILMPFISASKIVLLIGIGTLLVTHDYSVPIINRILSGFLEVFFVFTGILGDSLSYIRLFALGVSSSILGLVVNQIGLPLLESGIFGVIVGIIFLVLGHALNFAIAFLGALIHPLRLTFVEFYGNAQFEGGGKEFKLFKKLSKEIK
jgi:V/A-type H+-transporting ATPase subunit I